MTLLLDMWARIQNLLDTGGPVVALLLVMSVLAGAVAIYKLVQFRAMGVGRRQGLRDALATWDAGRRDEAVMLTRNSRSHIRHLMLDVMEAREAPNMDRQAARFEAQAETRMNALESGFRVLDNIAQLSPLLGLFGTVLGMIDAFQSLQNAGANVDPSLLAGGIWVALMTTAVGLAVAMPTSLILAWLEGRVERERIFADQAIQVLLSRASGTHATAAQAAGGDYAPA